VKARGSSRWRRLLRWTIGAVAALFLVYVVGINVFLRTHAFRSLLNSDPKSLLLDYTSVYSLFPGSVELEGLTIRGSDTHIEWHLGIERCHVQVSLHDLARHRFHASRVRADGVSFRVRLRVPRGTVDPEHVAALPEIAGFPDPPYMEPGPHAPPLTDAEYDLWSVLLEDVDADHVREVWIDTARLTGDLRVRGRWFFRPVRWLDVGPATVDARMLDISYGMRPVLTNVVGTASATIHPFDVRVPEGLAIFRFVSVSTSGITGNIRASDAMDALFHDDGLSFERIDGKLEAQLHVDHGRVQPGTHVSADAPSARVATRTLSVGADWAASLDVRGEEGATVSTIGVQAAHLAASAVRDATATASSVTTTSTVNDVDLALLPKDAPFVIDVHGAETPSIRPWLPPSSSIDVQSGRATADGVVGGTLASHVVHAKLTLSMQSPSAREGMVAVTARSLRATYDGELSLEDTTATGVGEAVASGVNFRVASRAAEGTLTLELRARSHDTVTDLSGSSVAFASPPGSNADAAWWGTLRLKEAVLYAASPLRFRGALHLTAKDASPAAALIAGSTAVPKWVTSAVPLDGLQLDTELRVGPSSLQLRSLRASGGKDLVQLEFEQQKETTEWAVLVESGVVQAGLARENGNTQFVLFGARSWFEQQAARVRSRESSW